jgi:hypothetical protein
MKLRKFQAVYVLSLPKRAFLAWLKRFRAYLKWLSTYRSSFDWWLKFDLALILLYILLGLALIGFMAWQIWLLL